MRAVPSLDERIAVLERRQRDRKVFMREAQDLYDRRQREIDNLKALRDAIARGEDNDDGEVLSW
jgi:hypothetical protein